MKHLMLLLIKENQFGKMNKFYLFIIFSLIFSQTEITTQQFIFFKSNEINNINFSDLIDDINGEYMIELLFIKDPQFKRIKRIIVEQCDLKFNLSNENNNIEISRCNNKYNYEGKILISEYDYNVSINYPKYEYF